MPHRNTPLSASIARTMTEALVVLHDLPQDSVVDPRTSRPRRLWLRRTINRVKLEKSLSIVNKNANWAIKSELIKEYVLKLGEICNDICLRPRSKEGFLMRYLEYSIEDLRFNGSKNTRNIARCRAI